MLTNKRLVDELGTNTQGKDEDGEIEMLLLSPIVINILSANSTWSKLELWIKVESAWGYQ